MTDGERLVYLILGNIGDEVALRNICEAHSIEMEEIDDREKEFLIHTNQFYSNVEAFMDLHGIRHLETKEEFDYLLESGDIVKTSDGFVWKNVV